MDVEEILPGRLQATFWPGEPVPACGHLALWGARELKSAVVELGFGVGRPAHLPTVLPLSRKATKRVAAAAVPARLIPVASALRALAALPSVDAPASAWPGWRRPSDSVLAWSATAKLTLELVAAGRVVPTLRAAGEVGVASWRLAVAGDRRFADLAAAFPHAAHALRTDEDDKAVWSAAALLAAFGDAVADTCARRGAPGSAANGWPKAWTAALAGPDPIVTEVPRRARDTGAVPPRSSTQSIAERARLLGEWAGPLLGREGAAEARLCLRLDTPPTDADPATTWPLGYLLQAADDPSLLVEAEHVWSLAATHLDLGGRRVGDPQETLVRGLAEAARLFPPIAASLSERRPTGLELSGEHAADLLAAAGDLAGSGLGVLLPAELTADGQRRLRARLRVGKVTGPPGAGITTAGFDADGLAEFAWEVALGDEVLSPAEFEEIVALKQPIVRWRGRWVRVDPDEALRLADLAGTRGTLTQAEALAAALAGEAHLRGIGEVEAVADGALATLVERIRALREDAEAGSSPEARLDGIKAVLRDYQHRGVAWLQTMADLELGTVLADDMGLGKTLQAIALMRSRGGDRPHLVVCPTSVVGNWERELARFAPDLPVLRHHGPERPTEPGGFTAGAVAVTSYGLVRRDVDLLAEVDWDVLILDEAQQVKNHAAKAARAVRRLRAGARVAMTGTPVENRLAELWAIVDFTNPGLLGPFAGFRERYAVPVERWGDEGAARRLRALVAPFLLRRVKTDPAVAADLPPKQEAIVACTLTREQATLYQAAVGRVFDEEGLAAEGIDRRGQILALLTALKQICNHPAQYLGETGPLPGRSGKLARTEEMLAEVVAAGDRALVFTQYRRMGELLARHLCARLGLVDVPFLHGGVPRQTRDAMVAAFQSDPDSSPILLISIKAGGAGLNLTAATHVVHYDRWWNPAVEDQATDRAYRIGQTRSVTVHKLVTAGTLEERIADLLERKRALADAVVADVADDEDSSL
ncbi:MAG: DEAD/DEAH box helicase [Egibacteraceae bacterium]